MWGESMDTQEAIDLFLMSRELRHASPQTVRAYGWGIDKLAHWYEDLPDEQQIEQLLLYYSYLSDHSLRSLWSRWRVFYAWLDHQDLGEDAMADIRAPIVRKKIPRTLSQEEIRRLLDAAINERDYTVITVFLDTGVRIGELASLTRRRITRDYITVTGKTGDRMVPISPVVHELLSRQGVGDTVWTGQQGKLTYDGLQLIVRRTALRAGLRTPKIGPHMLRHTFGLHYVLNGGDVFSLKKILGHSDIASTMIYVDMSTTHVAEQHRQFSPMSRMSEELRFEARHKKAGFRLDTKPVSSLALGFTRNRNW